jgi:hypothetical protein
MGVATVPEALLAHSLPTPTEAKQAKEASRVLSSRLRSKSALRFKPQSWNIFGCLRTISHAPPANVGKLRIASIRNPTRKTVTQTNTMAIHAERSSPSLALGLFNA